MHILGSLSLPIAIRGDILNPARELLDCYYIAGPPAEGPGGARTVGATAAVMGPAAVCGARGGMALGRGREGDITCYQK